MAERLRLVRDRIQTADPLPPKVRIDHLRVQFGDFVALHDVSLDISDGEFVCLIGPSGCGKTTLLNTIAGFVEASEGAVLVGGKHVREPGPDRGMVFQEYGLFPWFTVEQNVQYGPSLKGIRGRDLQSISDHYLELVNLERVARLFPSQLSGGMRQRVAIARALANKPDILLMDEPFGALDAMTRETMQDELLKIWEVERRTCIFVTHSIGEAIFLADKIVVMAAHPGRISGVFENPMHRPRDRTSADYFEVFRALNERLRSEIAAAKRGERGDET
jgi:ABC-type nitrate/sulfonate/bicarbonate transport system ATPase subunit